MSITDEQFGFVKGKSTTDAIVALRKRQERYIEDLHCVFIDMKKAYDRVPWEGLYWCMRDKAVLDKYIRLVKGMHLSMRNCNDVCYSNKRNLCRGSWTPPRICSQPFPVCHHDGFNDGKHQKKHLGRLCSKMIWCCAQGSKTCWSWTWSSGEKPWKREE